MSGMGSDIDDVLEDIAESEGLLLGNDTDLDRPMSRLSVKGPPEVQVPVPSINELRLGRRVLELEKERDNLAAELKALRTKSQDSTTIPAPRSNAAQVDVDAGAEIQIPRELVPIFSVLRQHISELSKDNQALRYTFGLDSPPPPPSSSPSHLTDANINAPIASSSKTTEGGPVTSKRVDIPGLDLEAVVGRVKELVRENEELGNMVIELGRASTEEWELALEESKRVITSLDNDLQHHFETVQTLREQLEGYTNQPPQRPLPLPHPSNSGQGSGSGRPQSNASSMRPSSPRSSHAGHGHGGRNQRDKDRRGTTSGRGGGGGSGGGGRQGEDRRQPYQGDNADRHRHERSRDTSSTTGTGTGTLLAPRDPRDAEQDGRGGNDFTPRTDRSTGPSQRRREEDRMSKRRR